jgi:hypothetical protein
MEQKNRKEVVSKRCLKAQALSPDLPHLEPLPPLAQEWHWPRR